MTEALLFLFACPLLLTLLLLEFGRFFDLLHRSENTVSTLYQITGDTFPPLAFPLRSRLRLESSYNITLLIKTGGRVAEECRKLRCFTPKCMQDSNIFQSYFVLIAIDSKRFFHVRVGLCERSYFLYLYK